jgi:hypothetical protein
MNHLESRTIGGISSSIQNRIAFVDERFIAEALGSFGADSQHPDRPFDRSAERVQTQILLEIFLRSVRHFPISVKIFLRRLRRPLIGFSPGRRWPPPDVFLCHERLRHD